MATFEAQVEGLTSLSIDSSSAPTQTELTQFLTDGAKELINIFPPNLAELCSSSQSFTSGTASTLNTGKVLRVFRSDGDIKQPCRAIPADYKGRYSDPDDMNYATTTDPVYYVENNSLDVLPDGGTCTYSEVQYPAVAYGDSAVAVFPDEAEHLVAIYASIKSIQNAMGNKTTSLPSDIPAPSLVTMTETLPSFSPSTLSISSVAPSKPVIDTSSVSITGTAPKYSKPGLAMVVAPTISDLSVASVPPEPPSISASSLSFSTSAPTYTTQSLTSQTTFSSFFPLSDFTDNDPGLLTVSATVPSAPTLSTSSVSFSTTAPVYNKPNLNMGSAPSISNLNVNAGAIPQTPSITTVSYTDATNADAIVSAVSTATADAPNIIDVSGNAPTYSKPPLTSRVSFNNYWTLADFGDSDPGVLSISAISPNPPGLSATSVSFTQTAPAFTKPKVSPEFGSVNKHLDDNEDVEIASVKIQEVQAQISEYSANIQNEQAEFNKENAEYQAQLQVSIHNAQFDNEEDARALQKFQAEVDKYQADVGREVQEYTQKLSRYQMELNTVYQAWQKTESDSLQQYQLDIQNELNEFNKEHARYQVEFQEAADKNQADLQVAVSNANNLAQEYRQEAEQVVETDKFNKAQDQALNLANAAKQIEDIIADNGSKLQKYSYEIQNYQAQVNKEIQEYQQNLEADLRVWHQERQTDLQKYATDIQNEQGKFNEENTEYQAQLQVSIENVRIDNDEDARKLQKFQTEISKYQGHVNHQIQEYEKRFSRYETELNITYQAWAKTESDNIAKYQSDIQNQMQVFNDANAEYQAELQRSIENARLEDNEESKKIQKYSAELQQYQAEVAAEVQEYQQNLDGDLQVWQAERQTDLQKYNSDIQNELNEFNKENVEYQAKLQKDIQDSQLSDSSDEREISKYSAELQQYQADVNKEVQEFTSNFQKDLEKFRADLSKYSSESERVNAQNGVALSRFTVEVNNYTAQIQKYSVDYQWLESQHQRLSADYERGIQTLIRS